MSRLLFSVRYGLRSILRGGTRTALALACVAFGALAYTGTLLLTDAVESALLPPAREATGGDLVLSGDGLLGADQVDALTRLVGSAGAVETAALAPVSASFLQTVGSGRLTIVSRVLGVEAETYPVAGPLRMRDGTLADALARPDGAVVTRDLAQSLDLAVGDSIRLARGVGEPPTRFAVTGVAEQVPDRFGNTILLSIDGARRAEGRQRVVAQVAVATADTAAVASAAEAAGWRVRRASLPDESLANAFGTMLPAAGLLGLLLAGVGIATTIQVTLARRRDEIAALKAVGYRRRDVVGLFAAEMVLLGLGGGVIGVVAGLGLAAGLYRALSGALPILIEPSYDPAVLAAGVLAGVATATVFGVATSVRASGVRPAALLRGEAVQMPRATGAAIVGLGVALLLVYGTLAGLLVGSVPLGIGMVALGAAGVIVVGGGLAFALSLLARLPVGSAFVRRSLQRRPWRTAAALAALVVGVFAVATAGGAIETGTQAVERQTVFFSDETVMVAGLRSDSAAVASEAARLGLPVRRVVTVPVSQATIGGTPAAVDRLEGRAIDGGDWNLEIEEGRWIAGPGEALASTFSEIAVGDRVRIETDRGPQVDVEIVGTYGFRSGGMLARASGLLVADRQADALGATAAAYFL
ncbi:MAG: FtsX-like permease family protein, partial [Bacteroidota bacterium]